LAKDAPEQNESGFFSSESVLNILKRILAGSGLPEGAFHHCRLVESQGDGTLCTIWLPDENGKYFYSVAEPSLPGFGVNVGRILDITSAVTSRLDFRQVVEALSTNLFRVMQCDVSALLLPDAERGDLRVTILYNPGARGPMREGSLMPMNSSVSGQVLRSGEGS
jgi:hypothetical protein